jgi:23S rRNA pseudouridine2605 synthase
VRLAKYLAHAGVASRRAAERLIEEGRVTVGGVVVRDPALDVGDPAESGAAPQVEVDGRAVAGPEPRIVYALNKPVGVVSTARDPQGRPTVVELVAGREHREGRAQGRRGRETRRLYPVGRLDADTSGLILLTNDGALAHRLTHPSFEVPKTYRARVAGAPVSDRALRRLREGVRLADGLTGPARVRRLAADMLEITIREGRNRQVRRMCEAVGHPVVSLERVGFGSLALGRLAVGRSRALGEGELERLLGR